MRRRLLTCGALLWGIALSACAGKLPPPATPSDVQWAQSKWPNASAGDLESGRQVLVTKCVSCHRAPLPEEHAPESWPDYINEMAPRAKLTVEDRGFLEQYVITLSSNKPPAK